MKKGFVAIGLLVAAVVSIIGGAVLTTTGSVDLNIAYTIMAVGFVLAGLGFVNLRGTEIERDMMEEYHGAIRDRFGVPKHVSKVNGRIVIAFLGFIISWVFATLLASSVNVPNVIGAGGITFGVLLIVYASGIGKWFKKRYYKWGVEVAEEVKTGESQYPDLFGQREAVDADVVNEDQVIRVDIA
jgi:hypothetical protein